MDVSAPEDEQAESPAAASVPAKPAAKKVAAKATKPAAKKGKTAAKAPKMEVVKVQSKL